MSQRKVAKIAGFLYLIFTVTLVFSTIVQSPIFSGDAATNGQEYFSS